jgi:transcriptional activator of cad operon
MDRLTKTTLRIGDWNVDPSTDQISRNGEIIRIEARAMRLLLCLGEHAGETVSIDKLLNQVWTGVIVTPDSVYQAIASLRRLLGDDAKEPRYIETVPRLGYRLVAAVSAWDKQPLWAPTPPASTKVPASVRLPKRGTFLIAAIVLCLVCIAAYLLFLRALENKQAAVAAGRSVAVLPFLDLTTQAMDKEYFADGLTEELIDKLSKVPDLHVPSPTSSFAFKDKQLQPAEIAKSLGVTYLLDGSVRKSETTLRIAARLIRANDGYVVWSETYDRPITNELLIQDDIATEVAKALSTSIK